MVWGGGGCFKKLHVSVVILEHYTIQTYPVVAVWCLKCTVLLQGVSDHCAMSVWVSYTCCCRVCRITVPCQCGYHTHVLLHGVQDHCPMSVWVHVCRVAGCVVSVGTIHVYSVAGCVGSLSHVSVGTIHMR